MRYFICTTGVYDQSPRQLPTEIFINPLDMKYKTFKKRLINFMFMLKIVKLNP